MRIPGTNIIVGNESVQAADVPVEKEKKNVGQLKGELGDSGTSSLHGIITEEYQSKLENERGVKVYDQMRKSDATVRAAVLATSLPIRRAEWFVTDATDEEQDKHIAEFVRKNLFDWMTITWDDFLRQVLLMLPFGVMPFEKVFEIKEWEGRSYVAWRKFAPRLPKTILAWQLESGEDGIKQMTQTGPIAEIPMWKLCVFVNEKEGDNWWGTSILRSAYKHWYIKDTFYKIGAVAFERQGVGVPYAKMPQGYTEADESKARKILRNMRANENAYALIPPDYEIGFLDMGAHQTKDPSYEIAHHNRQIVLAVLSQFLELGANKVGSRALSDDQSDLFLKSLDAVANSIKDTFNKYAIPQLVDLNFNNVKEYPHLDYSGIHKIKVKEMAEAYKVLVESGVTKPTDADEQYFRGIMGLPELTEEEKEAREQDAEKSVDKDLNLKKEKDDFAQKKNLNAAEISWRVRESVEHLGPARAINFIKAKLAEINRIRAYPEFYTEVKVALNARLVEYQRLIFQNSNEFKSWRKITFAEQKVNFESIQKKLDDIEAQFGKEAREAVDEARKDYVQKLNKAVQTKDAEAIKKLDVALTTKYKNILGKAMLDTYEFGKASASREMDVLTPRNSREVLNQMDIAADTAANKLASDMKARAKEGIVEGLGKGVSAAQVIGEVDRLLENMSLEEIRKDGATMLAAQMNIGRDQVFDQHEDMIYALQRSEILDSKTCNFCLSVDGRIVELNDDFARNTIFHTGCRGIWVEILVDEEEKPPIGGVPKTLRDRFGNAINSLIQPKNPIVRRSSAAARFLR